MSGGDLWQIVIALIAAGAVYGGIRADLRGLHEKLESVRRSVERAHVRMDGHIAEGGAHDRR